MTRAVHNRMQPATRVAHESLIQWALNPDLHPGITQVVNALPRREREALLATYRPIGIVVGYLDMTPGTLSVTLCGARRKIAAALTRITTSA